MLEIHGGKTKKISNVTNRRGVISAKEVEVTGMKIGVLQPGEPVPYLGQCFCFHVCADCDLDHRIAKAWSKFAVFRRELYDYRYSLLHRLCLFNAVVTPAVLYGAGSWTMASSRQQKLQATQRKNVATHAEHRSEGG